MKPTRWIFIMLFVPSISFAATNYDSLRTALNVAINSDNRSQAAYIASSLGFNFYEQSLYDSSLQYYYKFLKIRPASSDKSWLASSLHGMGACYQRTGLIDSAAKYYRRSLVVANEINDEGIVTDSEVNLGTIYIDEGLYEKALEVSFRALSKLEKGEPTRALGTCLTTIAFASEKTGDWPGALDYHKKALRVRSGIPYTKGVAQSCNNIGETFRGLKRYDSAFFYLEKALAIKKELNDEKAQASTLNNIGCVFQDQRKFNIAKKYFNQSIDIKRKANDRLGLAASLNSLAEVDIQLEDYASAEKSLKEAELLCRQTKSLELLRQNLELNMIVRRHQGDLRGELELTNELFSVKDSLLNKEKNRTIQSLFVQYDVEKTEQRVAFLERENVVSQALIKTRLVQIRFLIAGAIGALLLAAIVYQYYRMMRNNKLKVETLHHELHHRVKNNLQLLSSILSLQSRHLADENAIQAVKSTEGRINAMSLIHKKLYRDDHERVIGSKAYLSELVDYLVYSYGFQDRIDVSFDVDDVQIDVDKAIPIGLMLNEIISNALKHAYTHQENPQLRITLRQTDSSVLVSVSDNGNGLTTHTPYKEPSFGIKMINTLIKELKGQYEVDNNFGTRYTIKIPLST